MPIPDVLLYLGLGLQVEGISGEQPDPLLLSARSLLLLLQQDFGEALCGEGQGRAPFYIPSFTLLSSLPYPKHLAEFAFVMIQHGIFTETIQAMALVEGTASTDQ